MNYTKNHTKHNKKPTIKEYYFLDKKAKDSMAVVGGLTIKSVFTKDISD